MPIWLLEFHHHQSEILIIPPNFLNLILKNCNELQFLTITVTIIIITIIIITIIIIDISNWWRWKSDNHRHAIIISEINSFIWLYIIVQYLNIQNVVVLRI